MKKVMFTLMLMIASLTSASAMSFEQAREQALFLADKMAYELNLTEEQYEAVYEINLDYLMGVNSERDLYGDYWTRRNLDLSYILLDWQYRAFVDAAYFYRPLYWSSGYWHFGIYARYPHRDYFYFGRPHFYTVYRGGHAWHNNGGVSWYHGREWAHNRPVEHRPMGMRDGFNKGNYGRGNRNMNNGSVANHSNRNHGTNSSTRTQSHNRTENGIHVQGNTHDRTFHGNGSGQHSTSNHSNMDRGNSSRRPVEGVGSSSTTTTRQHATSTNRTFGSSSHSTSRGNSSVGSSMSRGGSQSVTRSSGASHAGGASRGGSSHGGRR